MYQIKYNAVINLFFPLRNLRYKSSIRSKLLSYIHEYYLYHNGIFQGEKACKLKVSHFENIIEHIGALIQISTDKIKSLL